MSLDFVPKNSSGVPTASAGIICSTGRYCSNAYFGSTPSSLTTSGSTLSINPASGSSLDITSGGIQGDTFQLATVRAASFDRNDQRGDAIGSTSDSTQFVSLGSVTITTTGRPVLLKMVAKANVTGGTTPYIEIDSKGATPGIQVQGFYRFSRDGSDISGEMFTEHLDDDAVFNTREFFYPPGSLTFVDHPSAGTYLYEIEGKTFSGSDRINNLNELEIMAFEL